MNACLRPARLDSYPSYNIATTFDTHMVDSIPNPGNDITYVAQTAPRVSMNSSSGNGFDSFGKITSAVSPPTTPYCPFALAAEDMRILQIVAKVRY